EKKVVVFNYSSNVSVDKVSEDLILIKVQRIDTHQELYMTINISYPDCIIKKINVEYLRCPGGDCPQAAGTLQTLVGKSLSHGISKELKKSVISKDGCMHLGEMVMDAARSLVQAKFTLRVIELDYDESAMQQELQYTLKDTCHQYSNGWRPHRLCED
ncbi:MAG: DUF2889 domain-containing protein, partial [Clostridiales bacterium]